METSKELIEKIPCPNCGSSKSPALQVYVESGKRDLVSGYCFSCQTYFSDPYKGIKGKPASSSKKPYSKKSYLHSDLDELEYLDLSDFKTKDLKTETDKMSDPKTKDLKTKDIETKDIEILELLDRGIDKTTTGFYGVKAEVDNFGEVTKHYYPYTKSGIVTGYKIRRCKDKQFFGEGDLKSAELFGQSQARSSSKKTVLVFEGELDVLSAWQMLKSRGKSFDCVGNSGANVRGIKDNWEFLNRYENILIIYDMDKVGMAEAAKVPELFEPGKVKIVKLPSGYKDPNELLVDKEVDSAAMFAKCLREATETRPDGIVSVDDIYEEALKPVKKGLSLPWDSMTELTGGLRTGELWTITAGSGCADADTEFLTPKGWKRLADFKPGDLVAQITERNNMEFVKPIAYHKVPANNMWSIDTKQGISMTLSGNHNVVSYSKHKGERIERVSTLLDFKSKHEAKKQGNSDTILTTFSPSNLSALSTGYPESYLRLKIAVFADGSFAKGLIKTDRTMYLVNIRLKKGHKQHRLEELLSQCGIEYKKELRVDGQKKYTFPMDNGDKVFPTSWYNLGTKELGIISEEVLFWSGNGKNVFYTSIKSDADFVQFAFSSIGYRASIHTGKSIGYRVYKTPRVYCGVRSGVDRPEFKPFTPIDGLMYCFTVPSNKLLFRCRDRIYITGNSGKTVCSREILHHLIVEHNQEVGFIFLEERAPKTLKTLAGMVKGLLYHKGSEISDKEGFKKDVDKFKDKAFFYDSFGQNSWDVVKAKIRYFAQALGVKYIALDNLTAITSHSENEYYELNRVMSELASLVNELDINIQLISHLRKSSGGKAFEEGAQISSADLRGSSAINFWSYYVFGIERNTQHEDEITRNTSTIRCLKDRVDGKVGNTFHLYYNKDTGRWLESEIVEEDF